MRTKKRGVEAPWVGRVWDRTPLFALRKAAMKARRDSRHGAKGYSYCTLVEQYYDDLIKKYGGDATIGDVIARDIEVELDGEASATVGRARGEDR